MQQVDLDSTQADVVGTLVIAADDAKRLCAMALAIASLPADSLAVRPLAAVCATESEALIAALDADIVDSLAIRRLKVAAATFAAIHDLDDPEQRRKLAQQCIDDFDIICSSLDVELECAAPSEHAALWGYSVDD